MPTYQQAHRPLAITTPLGEDVLLLTGFRGHESISQLFNFQVDLLAETEKEINFDRILGQNVTVEMRLANAEKRYFNGLVKRFSQGSRDDVFVHFRAVLVPKLWLLTKKIRSRTFQHLPIPDILRQVLSGFDVTYELSETYYQRDYCVQYRESDFDFASRLMEEEGIYYFFKHFNGRHQVVVTDVSNQHPFVPGESDVIYEEISGGVRKEMRITAWEKSQELRSGECTLWDHCFELPDKHLEARKKTVASIAAGEVTHKLSIGGNDQLEICDYPGGYAQRFDGVDRNGAPRPQDLMDIFPDSERTVRVRMEQEEVASLEIVGASNCGQFVAGHKFTLKRHFDADDRYLLTRVEHDAHLEGNYRSSQVPAFNYENHFACIPFALAYRPQRATRKPVIAGIQTATVVGPRDEEVFCDKYGRVKVQFHWDREGKMNADSSCWLRVAQVWAGKGWGAFFWPRIGHEVVVIFEEGDPDQPLIVGSVYNAANMPPFTLPGKKQLGGVKSASVRGMAHKDFNAIVFNDEKGHEHLSVHSERNMSLNSEFDKMFHAGRHKGERVSSASVFTVGSLPGGGGSGGGGFDAGNTNIYQAYSERNIRLNLEFARLFHAGQRKGERVLSASILTVGVLRGGGGSGGGFDAGNTMPHPPPIGVMGLNSVMVYGENLQVATGLNHQLAVGNNLQLCINPLGLMAGVPGIPAAPVLTAALGGGMGGNMQFTMGTSASFVMGQSFDINLGPPKIEIKGTYKDHIATSILCGCLGAATIVWVILYHALTEDHDRAVLAIVFQALVDALLIAILGVEMGLKVGCQTVEDALKALFRVGPENQALDDSDWGIVTFGASALILGAILAPLEAIGSE